METSYQYDYKEEVKSLEWQKKSKEIMERDNWTCQLCGCGQNKQLQVHHRYYNGRFHYWEYPDNALVTYCSK